MLVLVPLRKNVDRGLEKMTLGGFLLRNVLVADGILTNTITTLSNGYLGSRNDEERSEMRYVMRIAEFSESSNL